MRLTESVHCYGTSSFWRRIRKHVQVGEHEPSRLRVGSRAGKIENEGRQPSAKFSPAKTRKINKTPNFKVIQGQGQSNGHLPKEVIVQGFCGTTNDG